MSYDVTIGNFSINYTTNGSDIFYESIPEDEFAVGGLRRIEGKTGHEAALILSEMFDNIQSQRRKIGSRGLREKYDSPNGWGSTEGLLLFAAQIMGACIKCPYEKVYLSY